MTHDETRDDLAQMDGWRKYADGRWYKQGEWPKRDHPYPPTLDAANAAVPDGWKWSRSRYSWFGEHDDRVEMIQVPDTGNPMDDLYALALACRRAMEEKR